MIYKWGDLISLEYGKPVADKNSIDGPVPVFGTNGQIGTSHLPPLCKESSFILGRKGAYRGVKYSDIPFSVIDTAFYAMNQRPDILLIKWAYYKFLTYDINSMDSGSAIPSTDRYEIYGIEVDLPDYETQKRIVSILDSLDDKIELNNRINENLSRQLRLIFQCTFLDVEHPQWPVKKLGCFLSLERGLSYKGKFLSDSEGVPMVNLGNILPNSVFRPEKLKFYTGDFKEKVVVKPGDIVVANTDLTQAREVLGSAILIPDLGYPTIICSHHISIVRDCRISKHFIHGMLNSPSYRERVVGFATGTTVLALPSETILNCEFSLPPDELIAEYDSIAESFFQKSEQFRKEIHQLSKVRDSLLPQLMSGQLDVSEVSL